MRLIARIGLTLAVMVAVAPATASAQSQPTLSKPWNHMFHRQSKKKDMADKGKHARLCNDCQRALMTKRDGVEIPPVPPMPDGMMVNTGPCSKCKRPILVVREEVMPPPSYFKVRSPGSDAPSGVAVASDAPAMGNSALVSAEPFPIGVYQPKVAAAAKPGMPGTSDGSVMTTSATLPPASNPIAPPGHNRPHVISHLFGLSELGKQGAAERARKAEERHASIQYGPASQTVDELPAKMVYGK